MLNYGLILTCHLKENLVESDDSGEKYSYKPDLNDRCLGIINSLVDVVGIITQEWDEEGKSHRYIQTRATPYIKAGSRFKYLPEKIPFGFKELEEAVGKAIEKEAKEKGTEVVDTLQVTQENEQTYDEVRAEAMDLWNQLVTKDPENATRVLKRVEMIFGRQMKLSEITEDQKDLFQLVVMEMKDLM